MSVWKITLDGVTLVNLIMCIGFSVDFSAHFCYHFIENKHRKDIDPEEIVERTLLSECKPVLQGALSTLLGVVGMLYAPSYSFVIFFKMIFIVMSLGLLHSLILVPILVRFILDVLEASKRTSELSSSDFLKTFASSTSNLVSKFGSVSTMHTLDSYSVSHM